MVCSISLCYSLDAPLTPTYPSKRLSKRASRHLDASVIQHMNIPDPTIRELECICLFFLLLCVGDKPGSEGVNELCLHTNLYQYVESLTFLGIFFDSTLISSECS